jgi:hypothetical protein
MFAVSSGVLWSSRTTTSAFGLGRVRAKTARRTGAHVVALLCSSGTGLGTSSAGSGEAGKAGLRRPPVDGEERPRAACTDTAMTATSATAAATAIHARAPKAFSR